MESVRYAVTFVSLLVLPLLFLVACMDDTPTEFRGDPPRAATIQDALHGDAGNPFVFLKPPVVEQPSSDLFGTFNPDLHPVVEVCQLIDLDSGQCELLTTNDGSNEPARYTVHGGPGGETVTLDAVAEEYQVQIHFVLFDLFEGETYRIVTRVGAKQLAFADVVVVSPKEMRNADTETNIVFTNDQKTVPWKVRIDQGALCWDPGETVVSCTSSTVVAGEEETVTLTSSDGEEVDFHLPTGWTATVDGESQDELTISIEEVLAVHGTDADPSCFALYSLNDPETGEPSNCYLVRADTDTDTDVTVQFGGSLPILAFCPDSEVLQAIADGIEGWIMTSVEEDAAGTATRTYANVEPASDFGGCPLPDPTVAFGDGIVGSFASTLWTHVRPVMAPLLPRPLHAADIGFGGSIDELSTIFFWSRTPTALVVGPSSPSVAVGQTVQLTVDPVFHEDATSGGAFNVTWSSGNTNVASVDAAGVVTGVAEGTAEVTATAVNISDPTGDPVSGSVVVEVTAGPDLVVQTLTHSPAEPNVLDNIEFTAVVENQGQGPADPSTLMFKIGGEGAGTPATLFSVPALEPGQTFTATRQSVLGVAQNYRNTATADYEEVVPETDETNNTSTHDYTVTEAPDLVVSSMTHSPESPTTADQITFTATVENVGSGPSRETTLMFKIGGETPGFPATLFSVPALGTGETFTATRQLVLGVAQGYINTATADYEEDVPETDETNNTSTHSYTVTEAPVLIIDGVLSSGEWDNANTFGFAANLPEGGTTPATFFWQVVGDQFYAAVRFERSALDAGNTASIEFGPDPSGESEGVRDIILVSGPDSFFDDVRLSDGTAPTDVSQGGTNDGAGTVANDGTHTTYEMVHPLDSDDDLYDFSLSSGDQITLQLFLRIINGGQTADSTVPTPALSITIP